MGESAPQIKNLPEDHDFLYSPLSEENIEEIARTLETAQVYEKHGIVKARKAIPGELVVTFIRGRFEKEQTAVEGDYVATGPLGELYIPENFLKKYLPTEVDGEYLPTGFCKAIKNPFNMPVSIPDGKDKDGEDKVMKGDKESRFAVSCNEDGSEIYSKPYIIDGEVFGLTYK